MLGDRTAAQLVGQADPPTTSPAVIQLLLSECDPDALVRLLSCQAADVRRAAIVCLGLKGTWAYRRHLAELLKSHDAAVVQLAENSLWQIGMRAGTSAGNAELARAIDLIRRDHFDDAIQVLQRLRAAEPAFAETYNQCGIAYCFVVRFAAAANSFRRCLRLNRYHFAAAVSLAHTYVERGDLRGALRYYQLALSIHPQLEGIREVVLRLEHFVGEAPVS